MAGRFILLLIFLLVVINFSALSQRKTISASRTGIPPKIDGKITITEWKLAKAGTGFMQLEPLNGSPASFDTRVFFLYDDYALYIAAFMYDPHPDSIMHELAIRDNVEGLNADLFRLDLLPFNDGLNSFIFLVTASGVQADAKANGEDEDWEWDAVWQSDLSICDSGWTVEIKIPYSAIRFPSQPEQIWGVNVFRQIRRYREWSSLNYVDKRIESMNAQAGILFGIKDIKTPFRLSLMPYTSFHVQKEPDRHSLGYSFNYGADLKYGINKSFTLDMTLIPDFGQVQSDDLVLNLSPFELFYDEKRPFFTEGTELFSKGNIFYSRRIGSKPVYYSQLYDSLKKYGGDILGENPSYTRLINATKISGRTNKGLGIGVFNAMTAPASVTIRDSLLAVRKIVTQPFTNYNMLVLDQNLKNNSSFSIVNTNVKMKEFMADVSGMTFKLKNKTNMYSVSGQGMISQKYYSQSNNIFGHAYTVIAGKTGGNFLCSAMHSVKSDKYDPNDMGFLQVNNQVTDQLTIDYNIYKPFWKILEMISGIDFIANQLYYPKKFADFSIYISNFTTLKNYLSLGFNAGIQPGFGNDYYEPRVSGYFYKVPPYGYISAFISPDYRKKIAVDMKGHFGWVPQHNRNDFSLSVGPRIRLSDRTFIIYSVSFLNTTNERGYVADLSDSIVGRIVFFGQRDIMNVTNRLSLSYVFTNKMSLTFRMRHYWSAVDYRKFYKLDKQSGEMSDAALGSNYDLNVNIFNIDLSYTWYFSPGSELVFAWKNSAYDETNMLERLYFRNFGNILDRGKTNVFSVKILYYLDYQVVFAKKRKDQI